MTVLSKLMIITFASLLTKPFKEWKAFYLGLIDEKGEVIRDAKTTEEKRSLGTLEEISRKLKIVLNKFVPETYLKLVLYAYLLKGESIEHSEIRESIDMVLSNYEKELLKIYCKEYYNLKGIN